MKAMILAAGLGQRMLPLTQYTAKPLLMVQGQPLIVYLIKALAKAGFTEVVINVCGFKEQFFKLLNRGEAWHIPIVYSLETTPLGPLGGVLHALPLLGQEPFVVISGDIWTDYPFVSLLNRKITTGAHTVLVPATKQPHCEIFGLQDEYLTLEKHHCYGGISLLHPNFLMKQDADFFACFKRGIEQQNVTGELYEGTWCNVGEPAILKRLNRG